MTKPSITYRSKFMAAGIGHTGLGVSVQTDRWVVKDAYGTVLGEVYDRKFKEQIAKLLGIEEEEYRDSRQGRSGVQAHGDARGLSPGAKVQGI
jgi:hypothetical protein